MKPDTLNISNESFSAVETYDMDLDAGARVHIINQLTNLYSDPILAVIREYMTNAYDSHVEAGVSDPIEITLPGRWGGFFEVKDHGLGLSQDEIREIYSKYGASTKRGSDDFNGMLGFGCKAALTYSSSFTIRAVKNGVLTLVSVDLNEQGFGKMSVLDTATTDERNGVSIKIPVKPTDHHAFTIKARDFVKTWPTGTVLVDGALNRHYRDDEGANVIGDDVLFLDGNGTARAYAVMGNVCYPIRNSPLKRNSTVYLHFNIGELNFTPSREALNYTPKTEAALEAKFESFGEAVTRWVENQVKDAACCAHSYHKAMSIYAGLTSSDGYSQFPSLITKSGGYSKRILGYGTLVTATNYFGDRVSRDRNIEVSLSNIGGNADTWRSGRVLFVENFNLGSPNRQRHFAATEFAGIQDHRARVFWLDGTLPRDLVCNDHRDGFVVNYADVVARVKAEKGPRKSYSQPKQELDYIDGSDHKIVNSFQPTSKKVIYFQAKDITQDSFLGLRGLHNDCVFYRVRKIDLDQFQKSAPQAIKIDAYLKEWRDGLAEYTQDMVDYFTNESRELLNLDVDDPDFARIRAAGAGYKSVRQARARYNAAAKLFGGPSVPTNPTGVGVSLSQRYPLADWSNIRSHYNHVIQYINLIYKENNS